MPDEVLNKIKYLCKEIPKEEWSGILLYTVEGSIKQPEKMVIHLKDIIAMDKGSGTYTAYNFNEKKRDNSGYLDRHIDYTNEHEEALEWKIGQIHSHNTMRVFFSGVDMDELRENTPSHNYYLSLIVNNYMDMIARVAFRAKVDTTVNAPYKAIDDEGEEYVIQEGKFNVSKSKMFIHECIIESNRQVIEVNKEFADNVKDIIEKANKPVTSTYTGTKAPTPISNKPTTIPNKNQIVPVTRPMPVDIAKKISTEMENAEIEDNFDEPDMIEIFTMALFSGGTVQDAHEDLEDVLSELEIFIDDGITADTVSQSVIANYTPVFEKYFDETANMPGVFEEITQNVIELLEEQEGSFSFISKTIMSLKYMLNKFEEYGQSV